MTKPYSIIEGQDLDRLIYGDQVMDLTPVNRSWTAIGLDLQLGYAAYAHLEPGDGTRYEIYVIPMSDPDLKLDSLNLADAQRYVLVCLANTHRRTDLVPLSTDPKQVFYSLSPETHREIWTAHIIAAFISQLAKQIKEATTA